MSNDTNNNVLFSQYYAQWIDVYKKGAIREATMAKYLMTQRWVEKLVPELRVSELTRTAYQQLLNDYAREHERQTTLDFHHQLKGAILDAVDEGMIERDPTRKAIIKGKTPKAKKIKYLNQFELHTLLVNLKLTSEINWDWLILIIAKTGMRFSEALALTPKDFDFSHQSLIVDKTWDYKGDGGFLPTKNKSSVRKIQLDWQTIIKFSEIIKGLPEDKPIFVKGRVFNSTINGVLERYCKKLGIPVISIHGLRHTHASLLLFAGVSIASVARRLGRRKRALHQVRSDAFHSPDGRRGLGHHPHAVELHPAEQHGGSSAHGMHRPYRPHGRRAERNHSGHPEQSIRHVRSYRGYRGQWRVFRGSKRLCPQHHRRLCPLQRPERGYRGQPTELLCRRARLQCQPQGRTFRTFL